MSVYYSGRLTRYVDTIIPIFRNFHSQTIIEGVEVEKIKITAVYFGIHFLSKTFICLSKVKLLSLSKTIF